MRRFVVVLTAVVLVNAVPALASEVTVTGELVDHVCFARSGADDGAGPDHATCTKSCASNGQPVALVKELEDTPRAVRVLGEDLVTFRDMSNRIGLLERHCSHRNTSLEFGRVLERGIQCCYHGWHCRAVI